MVSASDVERLYLQAVLSRGILSSKLAKTLWGKCVNVVKACDQTLNIRHSNDNTAWSAFVKSLNDSLDRLDFEFRSVRDEYTGVEMYALINRKDDEIAQVATDYTAVEMAFFRAIVEHIMTAPDQSYCIWSNAALREITASKLSLTKTQGEILLTSFVTKGWLQQGRTKKGLYTLSTRSLLELSSYLKTHFGDDFLECTGCGAPLTRGVKCQGTAERECSSLLHIHCYNARRKRTDSCPDCKVAWPQEPKGKPLTLIGEDAASDPKARRKLRVREEEESAAESEVEAEAETQDSTPKKTRGKGKKAHFADADMDVEDEDEVGPSQPTQTQTRRTTRSKR